MHKIGTSTLTFENIEQQLQVALSDEGKLREYEENVEYWDAAWEKVGVVIYGQKLHKIVTISSFKLVCGLYCYLQSREFNSVGAFHRAVEYNNLFALLKIYHASVAEVSNFLSENSQNNNSSYFTDILLKSIACTNVLIHHYGTIGHILAAKLYLTCAQYYIFQAEDKTIIEAYLKLTKQHMTNAKEALMPSANAIHNTKIMFYNNNELLNENLPLDYEAIATQEKSIDQVYQKYLT